MITNSTIAQNVSQPPLMKVRDVARVLSVSRSTVHNLIDSGDLDASEINSNSKKRKHLRVTQKSLLEFYENRFGHPLLPVLANSSKP